MSDTKNVCDLCGLDIEVSGFELKTIEGGKAFCCEGCKGIFQMLHEDSIVKEQTSSEKSE